MLCLVVVPYLMDAHHPRIHFVYLLVGYCITIYQMWCGSVSLAIEHIFEGKVSSTRILVCFFVEYVTSFNEQMIVVVLISRFQFYFYLIGSLNIYNSC